jgi:hypothetical protein
VATAKEVTALCCEDYTKHVLCGGEASFFLELRQTVFMLIMFKKLRKFCRICNPMEFCAKYTLTIDLLLVRNDFYKGNKKI